MSSIADSSGGRAHGLSVQNRTDLPDTLTGAVVAIDAVWRLGCRDHQGRLRAGLWYGAVGPEPHILMTVTRSAGLNPPLLEVSVAGLLEVNPALQHKVATQGQDLELSLAWAWLGGVQ